MTKRRRITRSESDDDFTDLSPPCSDVDDASFSPKPTKKVSKSRNTTNSQKRIKKNASKELLPDAQGDNNHVKDIHPKSAHTINSPNPIRIALLAWYKTVHTARGMPWRKEYNPKLGVDERAQRAYEVWVSEIMLQQTQVATVIPYYNRWMQRFPTIRDLATANIDEVNALWKGLGYYSRASRLLAGAQKAVKEYGGRLPDNAKEMEANIPGIGRYSAGAICSIAYGERVPVLDGNVHRLLSRFLALHAPPKAKATLDILWTAAQTLVEIEDTPTTSVNCETTESSESNSPQYPGDINQALIELGSTVCKVKDPDCTACPLRTWCSAWQKSSDEVRQVQDIGDIEECCGLCEPITLPATVMSYPMKNDRKNSREELDIVNVIEWHPKSRPEARHFLMVRRPEGGLLAGLYEFPTIADVSIDIGRRDQEALLRESLSKTIKGSAPDSGSFSIPEGASVTDSVSQQTLKIQPVGDVVHVFSHIRKTYRVQWCILEAGGDNPPEIQDDNPYNQARPPKNKKKRLAKNAPVEPSPIVWVHLDQVTDMNIGTGVVKVWDMTRKLWERPSSENSN
ncbi:DNA glycosylase [Agrocybe pediades]|nr:DNA glycosylase [Agrocybe pediades]